MRIWPFNKIYNVLIRKLTKNIETDELPASDFARICYEIRPCDVILVEGHNRISEIIKLVTQSNWSHSGLYIGRFNDIKDEKLKKIVLEHYDGDLNEHLLIEGVLGQGIIVTPISFYQNEHLRICRPSSISMADAENVIAYTIKHLGTPYDVRHIFDLLRLLFPFTFIPRYLFSTIFRPYRHKPEKQICSSLLARAFASVEYPLLPKVVKNKEGKTHFIPRNPNLFTPKDFDYSPYFNIIKYPFYGLEHIASYHQIPWVTDGTMSNDKAGISKPTEEKNKKINQ